MTKIPLPRPDRPAFTLPASGVLENINQIRGYLRSQGYKPPSYDKIKADIERGVLKPRRGGGYTTAAAEKYVRLVKGGKPPDTSEELDVPEGEDIAPGSPAERRILADARLKEAQWGRTALALERDRGKLISREQHEQDLASRLAFFANQIDVFAAQAAEEVVYSMCGSLRQAEDVCALAGGDKERAAEILAWFQRRIPEAVEIILRRRQTWLGAFARGREGSADQ